MSEPKHKYMTGDEYIRGGHIEAWAMQSIANALACYQARHKVLLPDEARDRILAETIASVWAGVDEMVPLEAEQQARLVVFVPLLFQVCIGLSTR